MREPEGLWQRRLPIYSGSRYNDYHASDRFAETSNQAVDDMIVSFADRGTEDVYDGNSTAAARRVCPADLRKIALRKLDMLNRAESLNDLKVPPGNRLEPLGGNRSGQHSIRINQQYRIGFRWTQHGPTEVEIVDYH